MRAAGHPQEAAAIYRKIWQAGREGRYANLHYEIAALSLGDLLRSQKDYAGAAAAYEEVSQAPQPDPEVLQKANLGAGEMYDCCKSAIWLWRNIRPWWQTRQYSAAETARKRMKEPTGSSGLRRELFFGWIVSLTGDINM